jgi:uncharacterized RDD family membrane protein YckC
MEHGSTPAAWYADPSGRHEHRYWSGSGWTEHVADHGQQSVDPLAPPAGADYPAAGAEYPAAGAPPRAEYPAAGPAPGAQQWAGGWQQQPGPAPRPGGGPTGGTGQPADLGQRFLARLIDFVLLGVVTGIITGVIVAGMLVGSHASPFSTFGVGRGASYAANALSSVITAVISLGYFTFMEANRGQTLGKMLLKLRTQGPGGDRPTLEEALKRNAFTAIPIIGVVPVLGALSGLLSLVAVITIAVTIHRNTPSHRGWHDDFAGGTTVLRTG